MKKETMVAVFFGLLFGSIVAVFISFKSKDIELAKNKVIAPPKEKTSFPNTSVIEQQPLVLNEPADRTIVENRVIRLKGSAAKSSLIVIQSPIKELEFKNNNDNFSQDFPLALGENVIVLTNYPADKNIPATHKQLRIYYLDTKEPVE